MKLFVMCAAAAALLSAVSPAMAQEATTPHDVMRDRAQVFDGLTSDDQTVRETTCQNWMNRSDEQFNGDYNVMTAGVVEVVIREALPRMGAAKNCASGKDATTS